MDLILKNSASSTEFKEIVGNEEFKRLKNDVIERSRYTCQCCGWEGGKELENRNHLTLQVEELDEKNPINSKLSSICKSCYLLNHIDLAIKNKFVQLVNSAYSQTDLLRISWSDCSKKSITNNNREKAINDGKIVVLKKDPSFYLDQIKDGVINDKLKIVLTDKFLMS